MKDSSPFFPFQKDLFRLAIPSPLCRIRFGILKLRRATKHRFQINKLCLHSQRKPLVLESDPYCNILAVLNFHQTSSIIPSIAYLSKRHTASAHGTDEGSTRFQKIQTALHSILRWPARLHGNGGLMGEATYKGSKNCWRLGSFLGLLGIGKRTPHARSLDQFDVNISIDGKASEQDP